MITTCAAAPGAGALTSFFEFLTDECASVTLIKGSLLLVRHVPALPTLLVIIYIYDEHAATVKQITFWMPKFTPVYTWMPGSGRPANDTLVCT